MPNGTAGHITTSQTFGLLIEADANLERHIPRTRRKTSPHIFVHSMRVRTGE
ncbi:hypothetical protein LMG28614_00624 [Paraburkholderia ultramafica]|uniref:Uncharacterized protein n=1 Tax=Paraburkholderia ultramafica TaxID=1544867 RepID=A0A6S7AUE7_9BURK|nr:hypothetical protein LMG28614_00624 [Paraburkholderia ultramafica]